METFEQKAELLNQERQEILQKETDLATQRDQFENYQNQMCVMISLYSLCSLCCFGQESTAS